MIEARFDMPFEEALAYFQSKGLVLSPEGWRDVWQGAHARAFTAGRVTKMDVLVDIQDALKDAMGSGISLNKFKDGLQETLEKKGWFAPKGEAAIVTMPDGTKRKRLTGWQLNTIFHTNCSTAYSVGRYKQMQEVKQFRPFWQYMTAGDPSVRDEHAALGGKVYHADHPFWDQWYPPNGFNCRCYVKALTKQNLDDRELKEETRGVRQKPDEGWRYNPGKAGLDAWKPDMGKYPDELIAGSLKGPKSE